MTDNINKQDIGKRIHHIRIQNEYTQAEFAEAIDISVNFLSEIENGKKGLSQDTLAKICVKMNVSADYILFGKKTSPFSLLEIANSLSFDELETTIDYLKALQRMKKLNDIHTKKLSQDEPFF